MIILNSDYVVTSYMYRQHTVEYKVAQLVMLIVTLMSTARQQYIDRSFFLRK